MFTYQLRYETTQKIRVGVLLDKRSKFLDPVTPVSGALLSWYYWKYLIKADDTIVNIGSNLWIDIPNCSGLYYLTLTVSNTNKLGPLVLYIHDEQLAVPILMHFEVIRKNLYDSKYGTELLKVEPEAQEF